MWSLGSLAYAMLSGHGPFRGQNDADTLKNVAQAQWNFELDEWKDVSDDALDFIDR